MTAGHPDRRRLCEHADHDGEGMHWLEPGEPCTWTPAAAAPQRHRDLAEARRAGAQTAHQIVIAQLEAGTSPDQVDRSAESVTGARPGNPTPESAAFYQAYDETAAIYAADARDLARHDQGEKEGGS